MNSYTPPLATLEAKAAPFMNCSSSFCANARLQRSRLASMQGSTANPCKLRPRSAAQVRSSLARASQPLRHSRSRMLVAFLSILPVCQAFDAGDYCTTNYDFHRGGPSWAECVEEIGPWSPEDVAYCDRDQVWERDTCCRNVGGLFTHHCCRAGQACVDSATGNFCVDWASKASCGCGESFTTGNSR